jgi:hypothetical protein
MRDSVCVNYNGVIAGGAGEEAIEGIPDIGKGMVGGLCETLC